MTKYNDTAFIGKKFHMLTVVGIEHHESPSGCKNWHWRVKCECGNITTVAPLKLLTGKTKSCGCSKKLRMKEYTEKYRTSHGGRNERLYTIWRGMKQRCYCLSCADYKHYGERGITVCAEWKDDYAAFRSWALSNGYSNDLTIERIDCNGNYGPDNCTWIPLPQQALNKTNNVRVDYGGKLWVLSELCAAKGLKYGTIYNRIHNMGWPVDRAINIPVQAR